MEEGTVNGARGEGAKSLDQQEARPRRTWQLESNKNEAKIVIIFFGNLDIYSKIQSLKFTFYPSKTFEILQFLLILEKKKISGQNVSNMFFSKYI